MSKSLFVGNTPKMNLDKIGGDISIVGWDGADLPCVSVAQIALDCLTGSARMPAEGEAVVKWMRRDESRWRWSWSMTASSRRRTAGHPSGHGR